MIFFTIYLKFIFKNIYFEAVWSIHLYKYSTDIEIELYKVNKKKMLWPIRECSFMQCSMDAQTNQPVANIIRAAMYRT